MTEEYIEQLERRLASLDRVLRWLWALFAGAAALGAWAAKLQLQADYLQQRLYDSQAYLESQTRLLREIEVRLARIEERIR